MPSPIIPRNVLRAFNSWCETTALLIFLSLPLAALDRPEVTFQVFQFPADRTPRIDGDASDWDLVPESYVVGADQLIDAEKKNPVRDPKDLDVRVRVGWVKGLNRLYFLYEASDNYWDFSRSGLFNDTFEIVVDGDASGGPLIDPVHKELWKPEFVGQTRSVRDSRIPDSQLHAAIHGVHAQNYHIFTPALNKDWAMVWGAGTWIKDLPYANSATRFNFKPGESGKLVLECWITPFDYAGAEGPHRSVQSILTENKIIGLGWIVIDYDDMNKTTKHGFWVLGRQRLMYGDASMLPAFKLMPLEPPFRKAIDAKWSHSVLDAENRVVAFKDCSTGEVKSWSWDFGDGQKSTDQNPIHRYEQPRPYVVVLEVEGPAGTSRLSKVWDVQFQ